MRKETVCADVNSQSAPIIEYDLWELIKSWPSRPWLGKLFLVHFIFQSKNLYFSQNLLILAPLELAKLEINHKELISRFPIEPFPEVADFIIEWVISGINWFYNQSIIE